MANAETRFTPGPWSLCYDGQIDGPSGQTVCRFQWSSFKEFNDDKEWKATARLIAAAPEMYAALNAVLDSDMAQREEDEGDVSPILNKIRSALSRVEQPQ